MKRKRVLVSVGSVCLALVLLALLFTGACTGTEDTTAQLPQESSEPPVTTEQQGTQELPGTATTSPEAEISACDELLNLFQKPGMTITSATLIAATSTVPEHCAIRGKIDPDIGFAVDLPEDWNGKFYMVGNGVFAGNI